MIKVKISETNQDESLELLDTETGVDCTTDIIGNYGGLTDGQFVYDDATDIYQCSQETFIWWDRVLHEQQELNNRIAELRKEYGSEQVQEALNAVGDYDLEDQAAAINEVLDEAFK